MSALPRSVLPTQTQTVLGGNFYYNPIQFFSLAQVKRVVGNDSVRLLGNQVVMPITVAVPYVASLPEQINTVLHSWYATIHLASAFVLLLFNSFIEI